MGLPRRARESRNRGAGQGPEGSAGGHLVEEGGGVRVGHREGGPRRDCTGRAGRPECSAIDDSHGSPCRSPREELVEEGEGTGRLHPLRPEHHREPTAGAKGRQPVAQRVRRLGQLLQAEHRHDRRRPAGPLSAKVGGVAFDHLGRRTVAIRSRATASMPGERSIPTIGRSGWSRASSGSSGNDPQHGTRIGPGGRGAGSPATAAAVQGANRGTK